MRFTVTAIALLSCAFDGVSAFVTTARSSVGPTRLQMADNAGAAQPAKKTLTAADVLARASGNASPSGEDDIPPAPKIFEDALLDDMQACLLTLEKRVKDGPGCIEVSEVSNFEAGMKRIVNEMMAKFAEEQQGGGASAAAPSRPPPPPPVAAAAPSPPPPTMGFENLGMETARPAPQQQKQQQAFAPPAPDVNMEEDGPAFDGKRGFGLATGTRNTYVIPGMDEMSPEEYRAALQKSVSDRQERRRVHGQGIVGNRAAHQYLDQLGWGGASSNWKHNEGGGDESKD